MLAKVQKWGNSQGVKIHVHLLENTHIKIGEDVDISVESGKIIIKPTRQIRGKYDIKNLVAKMPENYQVTEENWGIPEGKEVW